MAMKCGWWSSIACAVFATVGCGGGSDAGDAGLTNAASFEGIYQLTGASENTAGCATPSTSKLSQLSDHFFVITASEIFGQKYLMLNSCSSVSSCQAKRAAQLANQFYQIEYSYTLSSSTNSTTLSGFEAGTGSGEGGQCVGRTYAEHVLTVAADHSVHLESRTKNLADRPQNGGFCEIEAAQAKQEAANKECSSLEVLDGSFLQAN